jgi:hypothetical protein
MLISFFLNPQGTPGEGHVSGNLTRQKLILRLGMQLTLGKKLQELREGHIKVKGKEGGGRRELRWNISGTLLSF